MRVVLLSDTHGQHQQLEIPDGDLVIHCGDFSRTGSYEDHFLFSKWLGELPHVHKICIPGNHDRYSAQQTCITKELFKDHGVTLLIDEMIELDGKKIYGSPWTPTFGRWYWMRDRGRHIGVMFDNIPEGLDLLATHGQPENILDYTPYGDGHVGCRELLKAIKDKRPKNVVGGHLHSSGGMMYVEFGINFYNAAICNEEYKPINPIHVIEI